MRTAASHCDPIWGNALRRCIASLAPPPWSSDSAAAPDSATDSKANVFLIVTEINEGGPRLRVGLSGSASRTLPNDVVTITPREPLRRTPSRPRAATTTMVVERYAVRYYRCDGRNTEGVDVPYCFQGPLAQDDRRLRATRP